MSTIEELEKAVSELGIYTSTGNATGFDAECMILNNAKALLRIAKAAKEVVEYHDDLCLGRMGELRQALTELEGDK